MISFLENWLDGHWYFKSMSLMLSIDLKWLIKIQTSYLRAQHHKPNTLQVPNKILTQLWHWRGYHLWHYWLALPKVNKIWMTIRKMMLLCRIYNIEISRLTWHCLKEIGFNNLTKQFTWREPHLIRSFSTGDQISLLIHEKPALIQRIHLKIGHFGIKRTHNLPAPHLSWQGMYIQTRDIIAHFE